LVVRVRLHATLRRPTAEGLQSWLTIELAEKATVASLLNLLQLELAPEHLLVVINRQRAEPETELSDGDEIHLFPPISGGLAVARVEV